MPRGPRLDAPGVHHHVMVRGVGRCDLFRDDADRADLLARLDRLLPPLGFLCLAWAFIPNHFHLVLRTGPVPLAVLMARLETGFAQRFNRRYERVGHLVQNRYRSELVAEDSYLANAIAYVFRNPLDAGLCHESGLPDFLWCGLGSALGARAPHAFESVGATLAAFAGDANALRAAVARGEPVPEPERWRGFPRVRKKPPAEAPTAELRELLAQEARAAGVSAAALTGGSRLRVLSDARERIAVRATLELGMRGAEIGRQLGVSRQAVSQMVERRLRR